MNASEPDTEPADRSSSDQLLDELEAIVCSMLQAGSRSKEIWFTIIAHEAYRNTLRDSVGAVLRRQELPSNEDAKEEMMSQVTAMLAYRFSQARDFAWTPQEKFGHWLRKVLAIACAEIARRIHRFHRGLRFGDLPDMGTEIPLSKTMERKAVVARAMVLLGEPHRTVLRMVLFEKRDQKDIAARLGYSEAWVSKIKGEAIVRIKLIVGIEAELKK